MLSTAEECAIVSKAGLSLPNVIYFLSRYAVWSPYCVSSQRNLVFLRSVICCSSRSSPDVCCSAHRAPESSNFEKLTVAPVESCLAIVAALDTCSVVTVTSTSFLFFLRVRAVYLQSRFITILFGTLWLVTTALSVLNCVAAYPGQ